MSVALLMGVAHSLLQIMSALSSSSHRLVSL